MGLCCSNDGAGSAFAGQAWLKDSTNGIRHLTIGRVGIALYNG